jgi:5-methylcytosine-specific restriction endonuclease McrA
MCLEYCAQCKNVFRVNHPRAKDREKYCSPVCRQAATRIGAWHHRQTLFCRVCLSEFRTSRKHVKEGACSVSCGQILRLLKMDRVYTRTCRTCARAFTSNEHTQKYCSISCRVSERNKPKPKEPEPFACLQCGSITMRTNKRKRYCSDQCMWRSNAHHKKFIRRLREEIHEESERIDRSEVLRRDKYICALCHCRIPKAAKYPARLAGTIDHILPLSKGGLHTWDNVQAAHAGCNSKKHTRVFGQLRIC